MDDKVSEMRRVFKLPLKLAEFLDALLKQRCVPPDQIEGEGKLFASAKVAARRLRVKLKAHDIRVQSMREYGYWLEEADKEKVRQIVDGR